MKMTNQERFLEHTCRTCGIAITSSSKTTLKNVIPYRREILVVFNYDINNDDTLIHPKYVCETCRRKLDRCSHGLDNKKRKSEFCTMLNLIVTLLKIILFVKSVIESQSPFSVKFSSVYFTHEGMLLILLIKILIWKLLKKLYKEISFSLLKSKVENTILLSFYLKTMCQLYF